MGLKGSHDFTLTVSPEEFTDFPVITFKVVDENNQPYSGTTTVDRTKDLVFKIIDVTGGTAPYIYDYKVDDNQYGIMDSNIQTFKADALQYMLPMTIQFMVNDNLMYPGYSDPYVIK